MWLVMIFGDLGARIGGIEWQNSCRRNFLKKAPARRNKSGATAGAQVLARWKTLDPNEILPVRVY